MDGGSRSVGLVVDATSKLGATREGRERPKEEKEVSSSSFVFPPTSTSSMSSDLTALKIATLFGCLDGSYSRTFADYRTLVEGNATSPLHCEELDALRPSVHASFHKLKDMTQMVSSIL